MKKWYYSFAINYAWSPSIFETAEYSGKGGYDTKEEAKDVARRSVDERIEQLTKELADATAKVTSLSNRLTDQIDSRNKLDAL